MAPKFINSKKAEGGLNILSQAPINILTVVEDKPEETIKLAKEPIKFVSKKKEDGSAHLVKTEQDVILPIHLLFLLLFFFSSSSSSSSSSPFSPLPPSLLPPLHPPAPPHPPLPTFPSHPASPPYHTNYFAIVETRRSRTSCRRKTS